VGPFGERSHLRTGATDREQRTCNAKPTSGKLACNAIPYVDELSRDRRQPLGTMRTDCNACPVTLVLSR
jgi:hypothetical protein